MPKTDEPKTIVIIPAFNEKDNIGPVIQGIRQHAPQFSILVVNDGSSDGTDKVAKELGVLVVSLPYNLGYGVALQTGFIYALQNGYTQIIQIDADGQHDPAEIMKLYNELQTGDAEVIIGSRFLNGGTYQSPFFRKIGITIFRMLASLFCGQKVTDPTSGFQALKGKAIRLVASGYYPPDYPDADFLILIHRSGIKMKEIPVRMNPMPNNKSMHHGHKPLYYVLKMFLSIFVTVLRQKPSV
ncbi:MAG: glycosyltransferase family 2 protein [Candidatus Nitrohelix vancouverensis]|uniref:Glycosyltransferase family 2 protein n=1 Tax=Candidatus Nitrohelix vancouverensis TaxID=2705534 RepID=A0A7T0G4S1_9BACT|nr:MAG: glycosyltransferase family 2 protein [Candidatus Nitrohelix vancouverensis]